jgi:hypothetical protein
MDNRGVIAAFAGASDEALINFQTGQRKAV